VRPFLIITILAALVIAGTAALFSVTGISSVFAGHFIQVAIMAGALETGKIVISSILYRYWGIMNKAIKSYMIVALFVLMIITSAGIFGYLSEAYQQTKSGYEVVDKEIQLLQSKKQLFQNEYDRYQNRLNDLTGIRSGQETRLDSLYSRGQTSSAKRIETNIKRQDDEITKLSGLILITSDSLSSIDKRMIEKQSIIITGDLGPIKYVADAFGTNMDTIVKWLILILIFVFDPLAVTLIVAANMIFVNKHYEREEWTGFFNKKDKDVDVKNTNILKEDKDVKGVDIPERKWTLPDTEITGYDPVKLEKIWEEADEDDDRDMANALFPAWEDTDINQHIANAVFPTDVIDNVSATEDANSQPPEVKKDEIQGDITQSIVMTEHTKSVAEPEEIQHKEKTPFSWKSANFREPE